MTRTWEYESDSPVVYLWDSVVRRALDGRRGQAALRELEAALVALPAKRLTDGTLFASRWVWDYGTLVGGRTAATEGWTEAEVLTGDACALGVLWKARHPDTTDEDQMCIMETYHEPGGLHSMGNFGRDQMGLTFALASTIAEWNDGSLFKHDETPEARYDRVLAWVRSEIRAGVGP